MMSFRLLFSVCIGVLLFAACSGAVLPVAENGNDGGPGSKEAGSDVSKDASTSHDDGAAAADGARSKDGGQAPCADSGTIDCLCGTAVCVDGKWTCSSCGGPTGCNPACKSGDVCVRDQIQGGPFMPVDDAGACPQGRHPNGDHCDLDPTYFCVQMPSACGGTPSCACAGDLCISQQSCPYQCAGATGTELDCVCNVP